MAERDELLFEFEMESFDDALKSYLSKQGRLVQDAVKKVGFETLRRVIIRTIRVDTGRMRNGWYLSFHHRSDWSPSEDSPTESPPDPGIDTGVNTIFVQNNVHYTPLQEFGTNRIIPLLMLTRTIQEMGGELQKNIASGIEPLWNKEINGIGA